MQLEPQLVEDYEEPQPRAVPLAAIAKIKHIQSDGVYIKAYFVPKGTKLYSKFFPSDHVTILAHGSIIMETENEQYVKYVAPAHYVFPANRRVPIMVEEDSVWYCVHPTDETNLSELEKKY